MSLRRPTSGSIALLCSLLACRARAAPDQSAPPTMSAALPAPADSDDCGFVAAVGHTNPARLLADYLAHDGDGEFTRSDGWRDSAMACPAHAPGWDGFTLIASYRTDSLSASADTFRYLVTYKRIGLLEQDSAGFYVKDDAAEERDTLLIVRTPFGWRVGDTDQEPHLLPAGALRISTLKAEDADRLKKLAAR